MVEHDSCRHLWRFEWWARKQCLHIGLFLHILEWCPGLRHLVQ